MLFFPIAMNSGIKLGGKDFSARPVLESFWVMASLHAFEDITPSVNPNVSSNLFSAWTIYSTRRRGETGS